MIWKFIFACGFFSGAVLAETGPTIGGCPVFPASNVWNQPVDSLSVHASSATWINAIGASAPFRIDDVLPINVVPASQTEIPVTILATDESDHGGYAIPPSPQKEPGSDAHVLVVKQGTCVLYELDSGAPDPQVANTWDAYSAAKWDLNSNALRPNGWTSADAAGLPMTPGVLRYDEVAAGAVKHAIRFTAPNTPAALFVWPARHYASHKTDDLPPFGTRVRLKVSFNTAPYSQRLQTIMQGLKKYGAILADNGQPWGCQHDSDSRWDPNELVQLHSILHGSDFEVIDESGLMSDPDSGQATPPFQGIFVSDLLGRKQAVQLGPGLTVSNGMIMASGATTGSGGAVSSVAGRTGDITLSINDISGLSDALSGKEQALTFNAPLVRTGNTVSCPLCGAGGSSGTGTGGGSGSSSGTASFVRSDSDTMGTWKNTYGGVGYSIAGEAASLPGYVSVKITADAAPLVWSLFTTDVRALQTASRPAVTTPDGIMDRIAAAWSSPSSIAVDVNFADTDGHQVGVYLLDWDGRNRVERVDVLDVNNNVLDTRTVNSSTSGQYLFWRVTGHVVLRVTATSGQPVVISGVFLDR